MGRGPSGYGRARRFGGGQPGSRLWRGADHKSPQERQVAFELVGTLAEAKAGLVIVAGKAGDRCCSPARFTDFSRTVPTNAEALAIQKLEDQGRPVWAGVGADERGLMYAELAVAERIGWGTNAFSRQMAIWQPRRNFGDIPLPCQFAAGGPDCLQHRRLGAH